MRRAGLLALFALACATSVAAQARGAAPPPQATVPRLRVFAEIGPDILHAVESVDAVFGTTSGIRAGGGVAVALPAGLFADVRAGRLRLTGSRAFVFNGQRYPLGIRDTLTVVPVQLSAGIRLGGRRGRSLTYAGGGIGWYRASETSDFAGPGDDVTKTTVGYHLLGGADMRIWRWVGAGGELQWSYVANGLAGTGIASALQDTNLGGVSVRARVVVGRW